ncbi:MAG: MBOAT family protein [Sphingobacteriia bacterium]|nr:MBOAT family protein [Sphingobacteriia bacterium]
MLFSSPIFLFVFLPIVLALYYVFGKRLRNYILLVASFVFFAWGGVSYTALLLISIIFNYLIGLKIGQSPGSKSSKWYLTLGVALNLIFLGIFKYADFIVSNLNFFSEVFNYKLVKSPGIILPVGISFYTFQAMSYLIDVFRKDAETQKNPFNLGLYISLFPQLIAGPIVRYHDIAKQIKDRVVSVETFSQGIRRFIIGLGKKVILANNMGYVADSVFGSVPEELSVVTAWLGILTYSLQIYLDFSGYSDMAIGLGKMFGFTFLENFNYPYISKSVKEFWNRWHISLSSWFRDYLYIPLGGNRKGKWRTYINLIIVFFITGLWHGASWSFVLWGFIHGTFLIIERASGSKFPGKLFVPFQHIYTLLVVTLAWVLFRAENVSFAGSYYKALFGLNASIPNVMVLIKTMNFEFYLFLLLSILSASGLLSKANEKIELTLSSYTGKNNLLPEIYRSLQHIILVVILVICSLYLITNTYNPFIYYRF